MQPAPNGAPPDGAPHPVRPFPPEKVLFPPENRQHDPRKLERLLASIAAIGQQTPGQVCDHPDEPGRLLGISGGGRHWCCRRLGIPFLAQHIPGQLPPDRVIELRLVENELREAMSPPDLAADYSRLMKLWGCSQAELAARLHVSESSVSRVMSIKRLAPDLLPLVDDFTLCPSVAYVIAGIPALDKQREAARKAVEEGLSRDQVILLAKRLSGKQPRGRRPKSLKGRIDGRELVIGLKESDTTEAVAKALRDAAAKLAAFKDAPPEGLAFVLK